jgi:hypothetical protein
VPHICQAAAFSRSPEQDCQIFLGPKYQNGGNYTKLPQKIPNGRKMFPINRPNGHKIYQDFP